MEPFRILVVTDAASLVASARKAATQLEGVSVSAAADVTDAREILEREVFELAIVDLEIASGRGIDLVLGVRHALPGLSVLVVTDKHFQRYDREAIKVNVDGFIVRPVREEHLFFQMAHLREVRSLREQCHRLEAASGSPEGFEGIIGRTQSMRKIFELVGRAARSSVPCAIYGESGTGKELVARAIHRQSARREKPFICLNASAIPESLLESELFGHVRGAFTGAMSERTGYIEAANGGTLFLDEIGDLPLAFQGKLLRVLQERTIQRIGSTHALPVDFRLVTATNRDLLAEVRAGRFREDLFYRIHVFPMYVPPLRQRAADVPLLADLFVRRYAAESGRRLAGVAPAALEILMGYSWPGNVRELENVIHRSVASKADGAVLDLRDLAGLLDGRGTSRADTVAPDGFPASIQPLERHTLAYVAWAYRALQGNKARTARMLEIDRTTLYRKLREAGALDESARAADAPR